MPFLRTIVLIQCVLLAQDLLSQKKDLIGDIELLRKSDGVTFLDYRLKRNPGYIFNNSNSLKAQTVHLFRGQPIIVVEEGSAVLPLNMEPVNQRYKLDLQLRPVVYAEFGDFRESLRTQLSMAPRLSFGFGGFYTVFQWILPFQNDFKNRFGFQGMDWKWSFLPYFLWFLALHVTQTILCIQIIENKWLIRLTLNFKRMSGQ